MFKPYNFRMRVKSDTFNDETRLRHTVSVVVMLLIYIILWRLWLWTRSPGQSTARRWSMRSSPWAVHSLTRWLLYPFISYTYSWHAILSRSTAVPMWSNFVTSLHSTTTMIPTLDQFTLLKFTVCVINMCEEIFSIALIYLADHLINNLEFWTEHLKPLLLSPYQPPQLTKSWCS